MAVEAVCLYQQKKALARFSIMFFYMLVLGFVDKQVQQFWAYGAH